MNDSKGSFPWAFAKKYTLLLEEHCKFCPVSTFLEFFFYFEPEYVLKVFLCFSNLICFQRDIVKVWNRSNTFQKRDLSVL